jgi:hypothetical protein
MSDLHKSNLIKDLSDDQARAVIDARQAYEIAVAARRRAAAYDGTMYWNAVRGQDYLTRSVREPATPVRRNRSLGRRSPETEGIKAQFDAGKAEAAASLEALEARLAMLARVNVALGLGRVPVQAARVMRAVDRAGLLGAGLRVVGTNAVYAYEAAAAVHLSSHLMATADLDLLFDARSRLRFSAQADLDERTLLAVLRQADRSYRRLPGTFTAANDAGFMVDLIKPMRNPPWTRERETVGGADDLIAVEIEKLAWLESAPSFEAIAIDQRGLPLRIVAIDPRVFAVHKEWIAKDPARDPAKRQRDAGQARAVAEIVATRLLHLPFEAEELRMMPRELVEAAAPLFAAHKPPKLEW